jgi:hypothetical protein
MEVYAFDAQTGEVRWPAPAKLSNYTPMDFIAPELPILVFMRRAETTPKKRMETLVLDARDGREILAAGGDLDARTFDVHADREVHRIQLHAPSVDGSWSLTFSDEPRPPSPPYGNATAVTRPNTGPLSLINSIIKAVRKTVPKQKIEIDENPFDAGE